MSLALIKIQAKYKPYSGDLQGFRILAALPNMAAKKMLKTSSGFRATNEDVPAFRHPYLLDQSMDYANETLVTEAELERFKTKLGWAGFHQFRMIVKADKPSKKLTPEVQAKIDAMLVALGFLPT